MEKRGPIWGVGFNMYENQLQIYAPGQSEEVTKEIIKAKWALLSFEGDGTTVLTLEDRKLQFTPGQNYEAATEDLSIVSVGYKAGHGMTLHLSNGEKQTHTMTFIMVAPARDIVTVSEYRSSETPLWEKRYNR